MRTVSVHLLTERIKQSVIEANTVMTPDIHAALTAGRARENSSIARDVIGDLLENAAIARAERIPMCQDTGMVVVYLTFGQQVQWVDGSVEDAINEGVRQGYAEGYLRMSVVEHPLRRRNTRDNAPAVIHYRLTPGELAHVDVLPKGFGAENRSRLAMLKPADGQAGVERFILDTARAAGPQGCPPFIIGVGVGGDFERVAELAKEALLMPLDEPNPDPLLAEMETRLTDQINAMGIGPQGFGGRTTLLGLRVKAYATHIASLPVAVNMSCHSTRHIAFDL
ncbi:MAG TPA: fumarate hydratase [Ktedonobacterales bacterium]|nr:fumarate hydratase [Ktedonobacterales bacterium]